MQAYTELIPPTGVTHAISLPFLTRSTQSLVIAKTSVLDILSVQHDETSGKSKLRLVASYPLSGTVTALRAVNTSTTKSGGDALLISFKDAKLSLVEWDPENHRISTISIHYYEGENVPLQPFGPSLFECETILTVDPSSRCAALKFGPRQLAVLPFRQQSEDLGGEDGFDAEMDDAHPLKRTQTGMSEAVDGAEVKVTPYKASFVLPLTALEPSLTQPVHLGFLHEYREPTLGILGSSQQASNALLEERKDVLTYSVFTLDLEQRASTNLVSVPKLPSDLWKVVPLPPPVGGALLVGTNELVHVDQSGKTNAVAVNEFARQASNLNMVDQSHLNIKLENCQVESLDPDNGSLLIVPENGCLATLAFKLSGRSVAGLEVTRVNAEEGGFVVDSLPSSTATLQDGAVFVGSETGDSMLLKWSRLADTLSRKRSHAQMLEHQAQKDEDDSDDSGDDDLYGEAAQVKKRSMSSTAQIGARYRFEAEDRLFSLGAPSSSCFGRSGSPKDSRLQMVAGVGRGKASRLAFVSRGATSRKLREESFKNVKDAWYISIVEKDSSTGQSTDSILFIYDGEATTIYDVLPGETDEPRYAERTGTEFEGDGETVFVGALARASRIVHCRRSEIRTYDTADLSLDAIVPQESDDGETELKIVHTSFCDPYVLVLRDDSSVQILKADEKGEVEPVELDDSIKASKWTSGCLHSKQSTGNVTCAYLLGEDGSLNAFAAPDFTQVYKAPALCHLPPVLSQDASQRRFGGKETLTELMVADVGPTNSDSPLLILRSAMDELTLYEPFVYGEADDKSLMANVRFRKVPFTYMPKYDEAAAFEDMDGRPSPLRAITIGDFKAVVIPGHSPTLILKEAHSLPHALPLPTASKTMSLVPTPLTLDSRLFALVDTEGTLAHHELSKSDDYSSGWTVSKLPLGDPIEEVRHVDFHEGKEMYVVASSRDVDFYFAPEDNRHEHQDDISLRPQVPQYKVHLLSAATHNVIHSFEMPYLETITSMKVMPLEISEHTHERRSLIVVGTAAMRGEDMPAKGAVTVFEIQTVVPDPERPESGIKLHPLSREETRGAVTTVESFYGGLIGTAQGQKLMIRGLKEDGSCLPVAFLDSQCYTLSLKTFLKTGMWLSADAWKGVWFGAFTEEPYKLTILGKSRTQMEVLAAEFLPFNEGLYIVIADGDGKLHCLQYDPENPKTQQGQKLLNRGAFHLGHDVVSMRLVPSTLAPLATQQAALNNTTTTNGDAAEMSDAQQITESPTSKLYHILTHTASGALGLLTPLDESSYRRLSALQTQLTSVLEHAAGLNPRAYRSPEGSADAGRGAIVDGEILRRIGEVGSSRRAEVLGRAGMDGWGWKGDAEVLFGGGLGWL